MVLLFDEVQFINTAQLEAHLRTHKTVQRELPITMVAAGLPQIAELADDANSYAERLFEFPVIGNLGRGDARRALAEPATEEGANFESSALDRAVDVTGGYPYFLQELGYAVWGVADGPTITLDDVDASLPLYESKLDSSFFRVRLDRATEMQRVYLRAMAELGPQPQKAADVAQVMNRTSPQVAPTRAELISMGLRYTPEHGYAAFTVPTSTFSRIAPCRSSSFPKSSGAGEPVSAATKPLEARTAASSNSTRLAGSIQGRKATHHRRMQGWSSWRIKPR